MQDEHPYDILVVDDDTAVRETLRLLLEDVGYAVDEAPNGAVALDVLRLAARPQVVLLDFMMPRMNGYELLEVVTKDARLLERHTFILLTAMAASLPTGLRELLSTYAIPVAAKPFDLDTLLALVAHRCEHLRSASRYALTEVTAS